MAEVEYKDFHTIENYIQELYDSISILKSELETIIKINNDEFEDLFKNDIIVRAYGTDIDTFDGTFLKEAYNNLCSILRKSSHEANKPTHHMHCYINRYACLSKKQYKRFFNCYREKFIEEMTYNKFFKKFVQKVYDYEFISHYTLLDHAQYVLYTFENERKTTKYLRHRCLIVTSECAQTLYKIHNSLKEINESYYEHFEFNIRDKQIKTSYINDFEHSQKKSFPCEIEKVLEIIYNEFKTLKYKREKSETKREHEKSIKRLIEIAKIAKY